MRKILLLTTALLVVLALCACSGNEVTDPTQSTTPNVNNSETGSTTIPTEHTHNYSAMQTSATCTEDGVITYSCICGDSYTEKLYALGHDFGSLVITERPSMTKTGKGKYVCSVCKAEEYEEVAVYTLEQEVQAFVDDYMLDLPTFRSVNDLSAGSVFGWVTWNIPQVSWNMDDNYVITIVYSVDEMNAFTQRYLGKTYDYNYIVENNSEYMSINKDKNEITVITGAAGGGGYAYSVDTLTDNGNGTYSMRYLAVDPYMEDAFEQGYYHYGNITFSIVDGTLRLSSHTIEPN